MRRPSFDALDRMRAFGRNLPLDLTAAVGIGVAGTLVGVLLPTIARRGGLDPIGLAALGAAPFVGNMAALFAGRFGPRTTTQFALMRFGGCVLLVAIALAPAPPVLIGVAIIFNISFAIGGPFQMRLWGVAYPARALGRVVGILGMGRSAAATITALVGGIVADAIGGPTTVALAGLVGGACVLSYLWYRSPATPGSHRYSPRESLRALSAQPIVRRLGLALAFWGGGFIAAGPLLPLVNVDRLNLSLAQVGVLGVIGALATTVAFPVWGPVGDRFGAFAPICVGSVISVVGLIGYALAPDVSVLWFATLCFGFGGASLEVSFYLVISKETTLAERAATTSGFNAVLSARGIVISFVMAALVQAGLLNVTVGLLVCVAVSTIGVGLFWAAARDAGKRSTGARALAPTGG